MWRRTHTHVGRRVSRRRRVPTYWVYVLACSRDGCLQVYYVGQTNYLQARVGQHLDRVQRHDRRTFAGKFDEVHLVWSMQVATRTDARRLERYLQRLRPDAKRAYMNAHSPHEVF
jgi:predicted GIY-YIG superfamily endonuclease